MFKSLKNFAKKLFGIEGNDSSVWVKLTGTRLTNKEGGGFANAAVRAIVNAACNGELQLKKNDGSVISYERKGKEPLLDLLYRPTPYFNENIFKQIIVSQMLYFGNVYLWKDGRDTKGRPTLLIPVPAPCITPVLDAYGYPYAYDIRTTKGGLRVPASDIIHVYEGNEADLFAGQSRMLKTKIDSETIDSAKLFNLSFFRNGASVGGVITYPEGVRVNDDEKNELLAHFNDMHEGATKAHRTAILSRGGKYESLKTSHKEMEYGEGMEFHEQEILAIAGVPPALVGKFKYAPQFNTKEQEKIFYETNVMPLMRIFADALSEELVPDFYKDESVYINYDFSKVKALEPDWNLLADAALKFSQLYPINEVTQVLGLPFKAIQGGDEPPDPIMSAFANLSVQKEETKALDFKKVRYIRPTAAQMKRHKKQRLAFIDVQSEIMQKSIKSHFDMQAGIVKKYLDKDLEISFNYEDCFGSQEAQRNLLLLVKVPAMAEIFASGIDFEQNYLRSLAPKKDFKFMDEKALKDRVQQWAEMNAFKWADSIEKTTFKRLDDIVKTGVANGMSNRQINNIILQFFAAEGYEPSDLKPNDNGARISIYNRVKTIVQTETRATISEAQKEAFKSTPFVTGKTWVTTLGVMDHHVGHEEMDGQEVGINEKFINPKTLQETDAPCQFGTADQDINCLCDMAPVIIDED